MAIVSWQQMTVTSLHPKHMKLQIRVPYVTLQPRPYLKVQYFYRNVPSVLWHCWLGVKKSIRPEKIDWWGAGVVICLERVADCLHTVQLVPMPSQNPIISCLIQIRTGLTSWYSVTQVVLEKWPLNGSNSSSSSISITTVIDLYVYSGHNKRFWCNVTQHRVRVGSEQFIVDGVQQWHMLGTFDRKLVDGIVMDHLRDAVKRLAELTKDVVAASAAAGVITAHDLHMHETARTPGQTNHSRDYTTNQ